MRTRLVGWWAVIVCCSWWALPSAAQDPAPAQPAPDATAAEPQEPTVEETTEQPERRRRRQGTIVNFGENAYLGKDESAEALVTVGGSATSEGEVSESVVAVFGNAHVSGSVADEAVAVFGDLYVDGTVGSEAVAIMGDVTVGPNAIIDGDVASIGGTVTVDPAAVVGGTIQQMAARPVTDIAAKFVPWIKHGVLLGRPLAFEAGFGWAWSIALFFVALSVIIALVFPKQLTECQQTFESGVGESFLAGILTVLLLPLAALTLLLTIIAIPLVPFLWIALFAGTLFGKAAVLAAMGKRLVGIANPGAVIPVAIAVIFGSAIVLGTYVVPVLGFISYMVLQLLGLGAFMYWMLRKLRARQLRRRSEQAAQRVNLTKSAKEPPAPPPGDAQPVDSSSAPMLALPRAGFWIRMAALLVDVVLVAIIVNVASDQDLFPWAIAGYGALMWKLKGTTIGGTLCNLQVVRLDGRELDWPTAIVRALSCYLSLFVAGLGFFWIAFDEERQAWHDKIAGTVVVRTARTVALV
jgi:uncharacterized RDD family membrane protein YckC